MDAQNRHRLPRTTWPTRNRRKQVGKPNAAAAPDTELPASLRGQAQTSESYYRASSAHSQTPQTPTPTPIPHPQARIHRPPATPRYFDETCHSIPFREEGRVGFSSISGGQIARLATARLGTGYGFDKISCVALWAPEDDRSGVAQAAPNDRGTG